MSKKAFDKIMEGLEEALSIAQVEKMKPDDKDYNRPIKRRQCSKD